VKRAKPRRKILDAAARKAREQTRERGPVLERDVLRASVQEHCLAKLGRLVERLNAG
jgi:hypothetical protein